MEDELELPFSFSPEARVAFDSLPMEVVSKIVRNLDCARRLPSSRNDAVLMSGVCRRIRPTVLETVSYRVHITFPLDEDQYQFLEWLLRSNAGVLPRFVRHLMLFFNFTRAYILSDEMLPLRLLSFPLLQKLSVDMTVSGHDPSALDLSSIYSRIWAMIPVPLRQHKNAGIDSHFLTVDMRGGSLSRGWREKIDAALVAFPANTLLTLKDGLLDQHLQHHAQVSNVGLVNCFLGEPSNHSDSKAFLSNLPNLHTLSVLAAPACTVQILAQVSEALFCLCLLNVKPLDATATLASLKPFKALQELSLELQPRADPGSSLIWKDVLLLLPPSLRLLQIEFRDRLSLASSENLVMGIYRALLSLAFCAGPASDVLPSRIEIFDYAHFQDLTDHVALLGKACEDADIEFVYHPIR